MESHQGDEGEAGGFHIRAAYRMARTHKPRENDDGSWTYPASKDVLGEVGLHPIDHYIRVRRKSIIDFVASRPVYGMCMRAEVRRGTSHQRKWWWEQEMHFDEEDAGEEDVGV